MPTLTLSWTSASVPAGGSLVEHIDIPEGAEIEILKTKVTASTDLGTSEFFLFRKSTALDADRALATAEWPNSSPFVHPIEDNAGVTAERTLGYPLLYIDESASGSTHQLHVKYTNNSSVAATYDCVVTYRTTVASILPPGTFTNFNDRSLWVPVYLGTHTGTGSDTMTFGAGGDVTITLTGNINVSESSGVRVVRGIASRFKLTFDSAGILKFRVKFEDVDLPTDSSYSADAGLFILFQHSMDVGNFFTPGFGVFAQNGTSNLRIGKFHLSTVNGGATTETSPSDDAVVRPTLPETMEIQVTISKPGDAEVTAHKVEYRFGGAGSYTSIDDAAAQFNTLDLMFGQAIFIGLMRKQIGLSITGKLTEFELIEGVAI